MTPTGVLAFRLFSLNKFMIVASVILSFIIIDMVFSFAGTTISVSANWEISLFVVIALAFAISQYLILDFIKNKTIQIRNRVPILRKLYGFVSKYQYVAVGLVASVIFEMLAFSNYNTAILNWATAINYAVSGSVWGILGFSFLSWYRLARSFVVLSYGLSSILVCIAFLVWLPYNAGVLLSMPPERNIQSLPVPYQFYDLNSTMGLLQYYSAIFIVLAPILLWVSSVLMLHRYSQNLGKIKFWGIMAIPLVFIIISPTGLLFAYIPSILGIPSSDIPLYVTMLYTLLPGIVGGILFGAPFFIISKHIPPTNSILKGYLILTAWGFILFNLTTSGNVLTAIYPPFGFSNVMLEVTASFLIFVGLYCSAISISEDTKLRQLIKKSLLDQSRLFDSIGSAHIEQETIKKITDIAKEHQQVLTEQTGIESLIKEGEMKEYLQEVIREIQSGNKTKTQNLK